MKLKAERDDILRAGYAPKAVREFLLKLGGINPYGEPNLRIALVDMIMIQRGGNWTEWPKGTDLRDRGGLIFSEKTKYVRTTAPGPNGTSVVIEGQVPEEIFVSPQKPLRQVKELRWIKRYPDMKGWMLQHWDPPHLYGSKSAWEGPTVEGTQIPILGPFPEKGAYEPFVVWVEIKNGKLQYQHQATAEIPDLARIEEGYGQWMQSRLALTSASPEWRRLTRQIEFQRQQEAKEKKEQEELQLRLRDKISPIFSSSLEAGRIREELAARCRARGIELGHVGN